MSRTLIFVTLLLALVVSACTNPNEPTSRPKYRAPSRPLFVTHVVVGGAQ